MKFGLFIFPTDRSVGAAAVARRGEELGFESFFVPEHSHIPVDRVSTPPMGGPLAPEYARILDPFVALAMAAAVTRRIRLGTAICLVVERDPIWLAKQVATLDLLSGGRFEFGVGAGWNLEEMRNHGTDPSRRFALLRERMRAMETIWNHDEAEFHGDHVDFGPIHSWPKPVQLPRPPVHIGGAGPRVLSRVVDGADGWMPNVHAVRDRLGELVAELHALAAEAGRPPPVVTLLGEGSGPEASLGRAPTVDTLREFAAAGVDRCLFRLPSAGRQEVFAILEHVARVVRAYESRRGDKAL